MDKWFYLCVAVLLLSCLMLPTALASGLVVDLPKSSVDITTQFEGEQVTVYGVSKDQGGVIVVLEGPSRKMTVRKKGQILGAWINNQSVTFRNVPVYYVMASSFGEVENESLFLKYKTGIKNMGVEPDGKINPEHLKAFKEAFIRNKEQQNFYDEVPSKIEFLGEGLFKAEFYLPSNVPVGTYHVRTYFFTGSELTQQVEKTMEVSKAGLGSRIEMFSKDYSFVYGVLCVLLALFSGWISNRVRSRA